MNWNKQVKKELRDAFKHTDFILDFGDGYLNISRPDGLNCEFYPCYTDANLNEEMLTATYTIGNVETEIDCHIPSEADEFVEYVKEILHKRFKVSA
jgi:hypothetical protein